MEHEAGHRKGHVSWCKHLGCWLDAACRHLDCLNLRNGLADACWDVLPQCCTHPMVSCGYSQPEVPNRLLLIQSLTYLKSQRAAWCSGVRRSLVTALTLAPALIIRYTNSVRPS